MNDNNDFVLSGNYNSRKELGPGISFYNERQTKGPSEHPNPAPNPPQVAYRLQSHFVHRFYEFTAVNSTENSTQEPLNLQ